MLKVSQKCIFGPFIQPLDLNMRKQLSISSTNLLILSAISLVFALTGCQKEAGEGGQAKISGKVQTEIRLVLTNPNSAQYTYDTADEDVYIVYGDNVSPNDKIATNFDGEFEFNYLRPGTYHVYIYSEDTSGVPSADQSHMEILRTVEINSRKDEIDLGTMLRYEKN